MLGEKTKAEKKKLHNSKKERYYNNTGWTVRAIEDMRANQCDIERMLIERERDLQR